MEQLLYLCSGSLSRKRLLQACKTPFQLISHSADETLVSLDQSLQDCVTAIALLKMKHIVTPVGQAGQKALFLTADTMTKTKDGSMFSKPVDKADAIRMLKLCRVGCITGTAFCLEQRIFKHNSWHTLKQYIGYEEGYCVFDVSDKLLDFYLDQVSYMDVSGSVTIEGFGEQFVKEISGSYSAILGLPMYKVRQALSALGFYENC